MADQNLRILLRGCSPHRHRNIRYISQSPRRPRPDQRLPCAEEQRSIRHLLLCLSITALVFFLAILTSRFEEIDFKRNLPRKLLMGLSCLLSSLSAMLLSFLAGHTFILGEKLREAAVPMYAATTLPVVYVMMLHTPLYFDLVWAAYLKVPLRSYKVFHQ